MREKTTKKSRGFGFVVFDNEESIMKVVNSSMIQPHVLQGKQFECKVAISKDNIEEVKEKSKSVVVNSLSSNNNNNNNNEENNNFSTKIIPNYNENVGLNSYKQIVPNNYIMSNHQINNNSSNNFERTSTINSNLPFGEGTCVNCTNCNFNYGQPVLNMRQISMNNNNIGFELCPCQNSFCICNQISNKSLNNMSYSTTMSNNKSNLSTLLSEKNMSIPNNNNNNYYPNMMGNNSMIINNSKQQYDPYYSSSVSNQQLNNPYLNNNNNNIMNSINNINNNYQNNNMNVQQTMNYSNNNRNYSQSSHHINPKCIFTNTNYTNNKIKNNLMNKNLEGELLNSINSVGMVNNHIQHPLKSNSHINKVNNGIKSTLLNYNCNNNFSQKNSLPNNEPINACLFNGNHSNINNNRECPFRLLPNEMVPNKIALNNNNYGNSNTNIINVNTNFNNINNINNNYSPSYNDQNYNQVQNNQNNNYQVSCNQRLQTQYNSNEFSNQKNCNDCNSQFNYITSQNQNLGSPKLNNYPQNYLQNVITRPEINNNEDQWNNKIINSKQLTQNNLVNQGFPINQGGKKHIFYKNKNNINYYIFLNYIYFSLVINTIGNVNNNYLLNPVNQANFDAQYFNSIVSSNKTIGSEINNIRSSKSINSTSNNMNLLNSYNNKNKGNFQNNNQLNNIQNQITQNYLTKELQNVISNSNLNPSSNNTNNTNLPNVPYSHQNINMNYFKNSHKIQQPKQSKGNNFISPLALISSKNDDYHKPTFLKPINLFQGANSNLFFHSDKNICGSKIANTRKIQKFTNTKEVRRNTIYQTALHNNLLQFNSKDSYNTNETPTYQHSLFNNKEEKDLFENVNEDSNEIDAKDLSGYNSLENDGEGGEDKKNTKTEQVGENELGIKDNKVLLNQSESLILNEIDPENIKGNKIFNAFGEFLESTAGEPENSFFTNVPNSEKTGITKVKPKISTSSLTKINNKDESELNKSQNNTLIMQVCNLVLEDYN